MSDEQRRYSEKEFAEVLHNALKLQESQTALRIGAQGLTLEEMKAAARDAGIDPDLVDRAVALLPDRAGSVARILGGPTRYRLSASAPGRASPDQLAQVVDLIRGELGLAGKVMEELDGLTWQTEGEPSHIHVSLLPIADRTDVRVAVNRDAAVLLTWVMPVTGSLVLAGITGGSIDPSTVAEGVMIVGGWLTGGLTLARVLWTRSTKTIRDRAHRILALIEGELAG